MKNLATSHILAQMFLKKEGLTVSLTCKPVLKILMDLVIEMTINRSSKESGGLTGKTKNPEACARWIKFNHFLVALRKHQNKTLEKNRNGRHIELGEKHTSLNVASYLKKLGT